MKRLHFSTGVIAALAAAVLFGASTPFAKVFARDYSPFLLAGLLYLGSGIGLVLVRLLRDRGWSAVELNVHEWPWLLGAIAAGGIVGPVLLMAGLANTRAATASLLLNLETVMTALIAWLVFHEGADRRIVSGMFLIVAGGVLLSLPGSGRASGVAGPLLISAACLAWAIDNNLTGKVSGGDALFVAGVKGIVAGAVNTGIALAAGSAWPVVGVVAPVMLIGFLGYGVSLALFVVALRGLGAARTGAYFSAAPFIGAAVAIVLFREHVLPLFWPACALMAAGVWLHLTERHAHVHTHGKLEHSHRHVHDEHHRHQHDFAWDGVEPHTHWHRHDELTHRHPHYPDIHHRHRH